MAAHFFSPTPFQPYVYESQQDAVIPFQILGGEAQIVQIMLKPQEKFIAKPDAFLCSINDVKVNNTVDQRPRNLVTGVEKNLEVGEVLAVDASCIVALTASIDVQIKYNGPIRRAVFGGDNLVTAVLTGTGIIFIQSLPFHRFSQRIAREVTSPNMRENPKFLFKWRFSFF